MHVRIIELGGKRHVWGREVQTDDEQEAIRRALTSVFGLGAYLHRDASLSTGRYGQIVRDRTPGSGGWQADTLTGRVRIDVEA